MSELETKKINIVRQLRGLCAHCATGRTHDCLVQGISARIQAIKGIPLIVNDEFKGIVMSRF